MGENEKNNFQSFIDRYRDDSEKVEGALKRARRQVELKDLEKQETSDRAILLYKLYCTAKKGLGQQVFFTRTSGVFKYFEKLAFLLGYIEGVTGFLVNDVDYITAAKLKYQEALAPSHLVSEQLWEYYINQLLQQVSTEKIDEDEFLETEDGEKHIKSFLDSIDKGLEPETTSLQPIDKVLLESDREFFRETLMTGLDKLKETK